MKDRKLKNHASLPAMVQTLYEASGHYGPWTHEEWMSVQEFVTTAEPRPTYPPAVQKAEAAERSAEAEFNSADEAWREVAAAVRVARIQNARRPLRIDVQGQPLPYSKAEKELEEKADRLWLDREDAGERLRRARDAYRKALTTWERNRNG